MHDLLFLANLISTLTTPWKLAAALLTVLVVMDCLQTIQIAKHLIDQAAFISARFSGAL